MAERDPRRRSAAREQEAAPLFSEGERMFYDQDHDTEYQKKGRRKGRKKHSGSDILYTVAIIIFALIFLVSGGMLLKRYLDDRQLESDMAELSSLIDDTAATGESDAAEDNSAKFARLLERNADFIGWISIEGTNLDYPVMYKPDEKDYYLRRDFNGEYDNYGTPYLDEDCTLSADGQSSNLIIYGHNM